MYYTYWQNNSGGSYLGPAHIIIEANSEDEASAIFDELPLDHEFCECCGYRWNGIDYVSETPGISVSRDLDDYVEVALHVNDNSDDNEYSFVRKEQK